MFEAYEKSFDRKVLKKGLLIFFAFVCWVMLIQFTCRRPEDAETAIERSELLKEHDQFCRELPRPTDFQLKAKSLGGNNFTRAISYKYNSKMFYAEVRDFYLERLPQLDWVLTDQYEMEMSPIAKHVSFRKGKYRFTLEHISATGSSRPGEYSVDCAKIIN